MSKFIYFIIANSFLLACNEVKKEKVSEPIEIKTEKEFILKINAIVVKDDIFQLFYIEDETEKFSEEQLITANVKGNGSYQDIVFRLPKNDYPYNIRVDLGMNKEQSNIKISQYELSYSNSNFKIEGENVGIFFNLNDHIEIQQDSSTYRLLVKEDTYDPYMVGNSKFIEALISKI